MATSKEKILAKAKAHRTRPAVIEGEPVEVKVYSGGELKAMMAGVSGNADDKAVAAVMADQFLDPETREPVFTAEWLTSDECTNAMMMELAQTFIDVNSGKKNH